MQRDFGVSRGGQIDRVMDLARRHLGMDVAYVAAFEDGKQTYRAVAGDTASFGIDVGVAFPLEDTYCARMVLDPSLSVIPDTAEEERVRDLPPTSAMRIGSYVGVPLHLADGTLYGTFCCVSHEADPTLTARDAQFLRMLAEMLVDDLEAERAREAAREGIERLIASGDVAIALQPIVDLRDGRLVGAEALSRFPEPFGPPDAVFAAAHDAGLGIELERLTAEAAFAMLPSLAPDQFLAINVAPAIAQELASHVSPDVDVPFDRLVVEITEHSPVDCYADLRDALQPLRDRGLRVAIDDAGAGFASLHHIVELRPDIVKIDRSLIAGLAGDPVRRSVVTSFVLLGVELDALVLAEGVETEEDFATARRLGVRAAQGYLFARPSTDAKDHRRWAAHGMLRANAG